MKPNQTKYSYARFSRLRQSLFNVNNLLVIAVVLMPVLFAASCAQSSSEKAAQVGGITAQQIIENPAAYVGKTVTVSGDVEEIHSPRSFNMDSGASIGELLVVGREPFPQVTNGGSDMAFVINDVATVTGVVRLYNKAEIDKEVGWDLDPQLAAGFNGKPVLVAQTTAFKPGANRGVARVPVNNSNVQMTNMNANLMTNTNGQMMTNTNTTTVTGGEITDFAMLENTANPQTLVGKTVNLNNLKVQSVVGDRTFYVGPSASQRVFIVMDEMATPNDKTEGKYDITAGQTINSLTGTVEKMPSVEEANQRFGKLMNAAELNQLKDQKIYVHTSESKIKK